MNYTSTPVSFTTGPYVPRDHLSDLKNGYLSETRNISDYMRADFNPIVETLNFVSNTVSYDTVTGDGYSSWNPNNMDTDNEIKPRVDFRALTLGASDMCNRQPCVTNDCRSLINPISDQLLYAANGRQLSSVARNQDVGQFDLLPQRDQHPPLFEVNGYANMSRRAYDSKLLFNGASANPIPNNLNGNGLDLVRSTSNPNVNPSLIHNLSVAPPTSIKSTKAMPPSAGDGSVANTIMMTPDSSTAGFLTNKFATSSDDGEVSPTPTNGSSCPRTPNRARKAAPTLATGRRNLKNEPVDPEEADRRMKRRERNRKSAQKCRERKVQRTQELQAQVECLQMEINRLTQERENLRNEARQFVNLLQIHCPGVAIPHMSCLVEGGDLSNAHRDSFGSLLHSSSLPKSDVPRENLSSGWRMRPSLKTSTATESQASSHQSDLFATIAPPMTTFPSQTNSVRQKAIFQFSSSATTNGGNDNSNVPLSTTSLSTVCLSNVSSQSVARSDADIIHTMRSNQGLTSGSSASSSSSGYEMAFPNIGTPAAPGSLVPDHLKEAVDTVARTHSTPSMVEHSSLAISSPTFPQTVQTSTPNQLGLSENDTSKIKCEIWDMSGSPGQQTYTTSEPVSTVRCQPCSPLSSSPQRTSYNSSRSDLCQLDQPTTIPHQVDNVCFS